MERCDFGLVHRGCVGASESGVSLALDEYRGAFHVRVTAVQSRGTSFRKTKVVNWPYSRRDPADLGAVLRDFRNLDRARAGTGLSDRRGRLGLFVDRFLRPGYLGIREFRSSIDPALTITAEVDGSGGETVVVLTERRTSRGFISAFFPHEAVAEIERTLAAHAAG